ncbi:MAG TPA: hypothetical protein DIU15_00280 [Deltaproteobacteria bacterium]|nr:hypothetical protein [Deltaproteobacteria bacterium]HCP44464.1 hypothetical protein [Deltaproteobacteria bacterium]
MFSKYFILGVVVGTLVACGDLNQSYYDEPLPPTGGDAGGPGTQAWGDSNVTCSSGDDCAVGEACVDDICQMARCTDGPYLSAPPVNDGFRFFLDNEIVITDAIDWNGTFWVDGYPPTDAGIAHGRSWEGSEQPILDVAGGRLLHQDEESVALASEGSTTIQIGDGDEVDCGFQPVALASADADGDGIDEVLALSYGARLAVCSVSTQLCGYLDLGAADGVDLAAADVDGDGVREAIALVRVEGAVEVVVAELQDDLSVTLGGEPTPVQEDIYRLDAGDLDGDGIDEVLGLENATGWLDWVFGEEADRLYVYTVVGGSVQPLGGADVHPAAVDMAAADLDADEVDEIVLLRDDNLVEVLDGGSFPTGEVDPDYSLLLEGPVDLTVTPDRIATSDFDGDSPAARLVSGPELVPGRVAPTMLIYYPPYDAQHSAGLSNIFAGQTATESETYSDTVSLSLGVEVGVRASFMELFGGKLSANFRKEVSRTHELSQTLTVGHRFASSPDPSLYGHNYGVMILAVGCFHGYTYEFDDPSGLVGGDGEDFISLLPVDGQTTVWSTVRYNAMAEVVGGLPIVEVPMTLGDPASYMSEAATPAGDPIPPVDLVFPNPPEFLVSDVGELGWWLSASESETNGIATESSLELQGSVSVGGFSFGAEVGTGWGQGYSVTVGTEFLAGGSVPAIPDDPATPEDEYLQYRFGFMPLVYRSHYTDAEGRDSSFYVLDYVVGF